MKLSLKLIERSPKLMVRIPSRYCKKSHEIDERFKVATTNVKLINCNLMKSNKVSFPFT